MGYNSSKKGHLKNKRRKIANARKGAHMKVKSQISERSRI